MIAFSGDDGSVSLFDMGEETIAWHTVPHRKEVFHVAFSTSLKLVASASRDKTVVLTLVKDGITSI